MAKYDLRHYDGVLAFGNVLRDLYLKRKGRSAPGPGTRLPIPVSSSRCRKRGTKAT